VRYLVGNRRSARRDFSSEVLRPVQGLRVEKRSEIDLLPTCDQSRDVAVEVKGGVKVIVEDKVDTLGLTELPGRECLTI
jgi:hypothetical protein